MPGTSGAGESAIVEDAVGSEVVRGSCAEGARLLGGDSGAHCGVCGRVFTLTRAGLVRIYGPIGNRCPGSPHPS